MSNQRSLAQTLALLFGIAFLGFGVLGFIPGITTNVGDMKFAGNDSPSELLGIFQVSILHNIVHLLFGIAGIALSRTWESARTYLFGSGLIYFGLLLFGLIVSFRDINDANFVPVNDADNLLHLALAIGLLGSWYITRTGDEIGRERPAATTGP
jgi:Domain of unknown function (DUF4383)